MSQHLLLSFRFLSPWFHGRADEGAPEWPPSPLRAFQAVVAAAARGGTLDETRPALEWLEQRPNPLIIAPEAIESTSGYRLSVPHNAMDLVGKQWSRGLEGNAAEHRTMKNVRPSRLPDDAVVHYAWHLEDGADVSEALIRAARGVVALGWGVDLVVGEGGVVDGSRLAELQKGLKTWEPRSDGRTELRAPKAGTLADLDRRHEAFLIRTSLETPLLTPPPALSVFSITPYARTDEQPATDVAAFTLLRTSSDELRSFDTPRKGMAVAGMLRHATRLAAERSGWEEERVRGSILGHGERDEPRLLLVPVPSIEFRGSADAWRVGSIRRVLVFSRDSRDGDVAWAKRALGGAELVDERTGEVHALVAAGTTRDRAFSRYLHESRTWVTVTPMVLPGYDDPGGLRRRLRSIREAGEQKSVLERLMRRREALVRKAMRHAGLSDELAFSATIETSEVGFIAGVDRADRYAVPSHLVKSPRMHVKITFASAVRGPLCLGRGRFSGMGLFVGST